MLQSDLVLFNKNSIEELLDNFGFKTATEGNKTVIVSSDGQPIKCPSCDKEITSKKVGTIAHGSRLVFCDNPICFSNWIAENKLD